MSEAVFDKLISTNESTKFLTWRATQMKAIGNPAVPAWLFWQLTCLAYCKEWVAECTVTLSQLRELQLTAIFFHQLLSLLKVDVANPTNSRRWDHCSINTVWHLVQCLSNNLQESQQPENKCAYIFQELSISPESFPFLYSHPFSLSYLDSNAGAIWNFAFA